MDPLPPDCAPSVLTSDVCNEAEAIFNTLQNKEKLVSFLDCTTILRGMGMNPNQADMDRLRSLMAQPIVRLEQWRREEELRREKERRREEAKERKSGLKAVLKANIKRKSVVEKAIEASEENEKQAKIVPVEEIKNIDWNIFISCAEEIYRDSMAEEKLVLDALKVFAEKNNSQKLLMPTEELVKVLVSNGDNVLTPAETKQLKAVLPEECGIAELARRIQGTYVLPTQEELDRLVLEHTRALQRKEEIERITTSANDNLLHEL